MKLNIVVLILPLMSFLSCTHDKNVCENKTTYYYMTLAQAQKEELKQDTAVSMFVEVIDVIDSLTMDFVYSSGGFKENSLELIEGCKSGEEAEKLFLKRDFISRISNKLELIIQRYGRDNVLVKNYEFILNEFFLSKDKIFSQAYLNQSPFALIISDLYLSQLYLNDAINNYKRRGSKESLDSL